MQGSGILYVHEDGLIGVQLFGTTEGIMNKFMSSGNLLSGQVLGSNRSRQMRGNTVGWWSSPIVVQAGKYIIALVKSD